MKGADMIKALAKFLRKGGLSQLTLKYYSPEVGARWTFDDEGAADPSLQIVYERDIEMNGTTEHEKFWMYLSPEDAAHVGAILVAYGLAHGEKG